jgi:hypothetical protein
MEIAVRVVTTDVLIIAVRALITEVQGQKAVQDQPVKIVVRALITEVQGQ